MEYSKENYQIIKFGFRFGKSSFTTGSTELLRTLLITEGLKALLTATDFK